MRIPLWKSLAVAGLPKAPDKAHRDKKEVCVYVCRKNSGSHTRFEVCQRFHGSAD